MIWSPWSWRSSPGWGRRWPWRSRWSWRPRAEGGCWCKPSGSPTGLCRTLFWLFTWGEKKMFPQSHWAVCYRWEVVHHIRLNVTHRNGMGVPEMQPPSEQAPHRLPRASNCQILRNESFQHSPASLISDKPSSCLSPGRAALPHSNARDVWMHQATNQTLHILWKTGALRTPLQPIPNASIFKTGSEKQPYIILLHQESYGQKHPKNCIKVQAGRFLLFNSCRIWNFLSCL